MKSFREQTYYELLEVGHAAQADEVRAALDRALETYSPDSVALYALVDEVQAQALRSRLQEAARVLLDPAARAGYDRMLGLGPDLAVDVPLWEEDAELEEEAQAQAQAQAPAADAPVEAEAERGMSRGPYPRTEPAGLARLAGQPTLNGVQASLALDAPPSRWPAAEPGAGVHARPPGLPSPTPRPATAPSTVAARRSGPAPVPAAAAVPPPGVAASEPRREPSPPGPAPSVEERPRMPELPPDVEFNGELLRQVREARGLTLQQVAERTRIGRSHLEKVEADRYADLPPPVYLRGILVSLARELRLDAARVSKSYLLLAARSGRPEP
jgi:hypothetical protein